MGWVFGGDSRGDAVQRFTTVNALQEALIADAVYAKYGVTALLGLSWPLLPEASYLRVHISRPHVEFARVLNGPDSA